MADPSFISGSNYPLSGESPVKAGTVVPAREIWSDFLEDTGESGPSVALRGCVLKAPQARVIAVPFEVEAHEYVSDFPLPADARRKGHQPPAGEEVEPEGPSVEEMEAAWHERLEAAVAEAREAAYHEGYTAAQNDLQASFDEQRAALAQDVEHLKTAWGGFLKKSEVALANLAFNIAQALVEGPLPQDVKAVSAQALAQALEAFSTQTSIEIILHPDDHARLESYGLLEDLEKIASPLRWHTNPALARGDWVVQSPDAAIRHLKEEMMTQLKNRLGLLAVVHAKR